MKRSLYKKLLLFFIIFMFIYGIYFITKPLIEPESFVNADSFVNAESFVGTECPDTMIKDGNKILLYNPKLAKVPGVNPIQLDTLDDYEEYVAWQRANNLKCPILHLEKVFDIEGSSMYDVKSSYNTSTSTGYINHNLPVIGSPTCSEQNDTFNIGQYPAYDKDNQDIGRINPIDNAI